MKFITGFVVIIAASLVVTLVVSSFGSQEGDIVDVKTQVAN